MQPCAPALDDLRKVLEALERRLQMLKAGESTGGDSSAIDLLPLVDELFEETDALIAGIGSVDHECQRYRNRFLHAPAAYVCTNPEGTVIEANRVAGALLGLPPERLQGRSFDGYVHPECVPALQTILAALRRGEEAPVQDVVLVRHDGSTVPAAATVSLIREAGGRLVECAWVFRDTSVQKKAEQALKESEERYRELTESISDIFFALDRDLRVTYWNRVAARVSGISPEKVRGSVIFEVLPILHDEAVVAFFNDLSGARKAGVSECRFLLHGMEYFFEVRAYPTREGISVYIRDISDRKRAEEALRRSEERYRAVVESQTELIYRWRPDGTVTFVNEAYCTYIGIKCDDLIGRRYSPAVPADDQRLIRQNLASLTPANPVSAVEHRVIMPDGRIRWQQWTDRALFDEQGRLIEYQSVGRDITDRRMAEEALMLVNRKLNLLSEVTRHDILNKLNVLMGYLELARTEIADPEMLAYFRKEEEAARDIQRYIIFTKEYQDIGVTSPQWQGVGGLVEQATASLDLGPVTLEVAVGDLAVYADPLIVLVFLNLLDNSLRHGQHVSRIRLSIEESDPGITLVYEDDGIGIPYDEKDRAFKRGYGRQTGFGLFLAREILSITGIAIRETGEPGVGVRFEIGIPAGCYRHEDRVSSSRQASD
jgi:PAS domain S-box-containing protein